MSVVFQRAIKFTDLNDTLFENSQVGVQDVPSEFANMQNEEMNFIHKVQTIKPMAKGTSEILNFTIPSSYVNQHIEFVTHMNVVAYSGEFLATVCSLVKDDKDGSLEVLYRITALEDTKGERNTILCLNIKGFKVI